MSVTTKSLGPKPCPACSQVVEHVKRTYKGTQGAVPIVLREQHKDGDEWCLSGGMRLRPPAKEGETLRHREGWTGQVSTVLHKAVLVERSDGVLVHGEDEEFTRP